MAANQKASADLTWVFRGQDSGVPINIADINSINSEPASHAQSLFKHHQALKNSLDDFPYVANSLLAFNSNIPCVNLRYLCACCVSFSQFAYL